MSPKNVSFYDSDEQEIAALLDVLRETGQRLEELTAGEVDVAVDLEGRVLLLRGTRQQLEQNELARQAAILNALPAYIGYIIIEHDLDVALRVSTYVTMMHNGRIFTEGTPEQIENDAAVQAIYLGAGHG